MKLEITLTDEQIAELKAALLKTEPKLLPAMPSEADLPESPEGFHPAMMGPLNGEVKDKDVLYWSRMRTAWHDPETVNCRNIFALRKGSQIARLNGLETEEKPEPRKAREWDVHLDKRGDVYDCCEPNSEIFASMTRVRVREVLPDEPTPEQANQPTPALEPSSDLPEGLPPLPPGTRYGGQLKDFEGIVQGYVLDQDCEEKWIGCFDWHGKKHFPNDDSANWHIAIPI